MAIRTVIVIKVFKENIFVIHFKLRMGAPPPTLTSSMYEEEVKKTLIRKIWFFEPPNLGAASTPCPIITT